MFPDPFQRSTKLSGSTFPTLMLFWNMPLCTGRLVLVPYLSLTLLHYPSSQAHHMPPLTTDRTVPQTSWSCNNWTRNLARTISLWDFLVQVGSEIALEKPFPWGIHAVPLTDPQPGGEERPNMKISGGGDSELQNHQDCYRQTKNKAYQSG